MVSRQMTPNEETDDLPPEVQNITEIADPHDYLDPLDPGYGKLVNFLDFWPRPESEPPCRRQRPRGRHQSSPAHRGHPLGKA
jgi:hypothetical protein